jgi:xanthine dehydrogenase small subunit
MRLAALESNGRDLKDEAVVQSALLAHLCRCTGWRTIFEAAEEATNEQAFRPPPAERDLESARLRASLEGGSPQAVGPHVALGAGGFADDTAPAESLVAIPDGSGGYSIADTVREARAGAGRIQGRHSTLEPRHPLELPPRDSALTLRTTFVEPGDLEPDASWCEPCSEPASALANGGAFGGKVTASVGVVARQLAHERDRAVRVLWSREDVVRLGPKRPPIAVGIKEDGTGRARVARTPGSSDLGSWIDAFNKVLPDVVVEEVEVAGPPVSHLVHGSGWAEAAVLAAALDARTGGRLGWDVPVTVRSPEGARATARICSDGPITLDVSAGAALDEVVLRSYAVGAAHQGLGWVRSEAIAVAEDGEVLDLTIRSFGIIPARDMPHVEVDIEDAEGPPLRVADAVFAAVAAAAWIGEGLAPDWPVSRGLKR